MPYHYLSTTGNFSLKFLGKSLILSLLCLYSTAAVCQPLDVSTCASIEKRSNGNGQAGLAAGDFRPLSTQNNPVAPNVVGTSYQVVPYLPSSKTGNVHFKWTSGSSITNIPVITRVWLTAAGSTSGTLSNIKFGPPSAITPSAPNYYVDYAFYNSNMPAQGFVTLEFSDPQTGVPVTRCTYSLNSNTAASNPTIDCTPSITTQPVSQVLCGSTTASFSVSASGATAYQWQVSTNNGTLYTNLNNGGNYSGATSTVLTVANPVTYRNNLYRVVLSGSGCPSATSSAALLVANSKPTAVFQGATSLCGTGSRSLAVNLTGTGPWNLTYDATTSGITTSSTISNITGSPYYMAVYPSAATTYVITSTSDAYCSNITPLGNTSVTVNAQPSVAVVNPSVCIGNNNFNLSYTTSGSADRYAITTGTRAMPGFSAVSNATLAGSPAAITIPTGGISQGQYDFNIAVTNSTTGCISSVVPFTLTVNALPVLSASSSASLVCASSAVSLTAAPVGLSSYSWTSSTGEVVASVLNPTVNPAQSTSYTVTGTNSNGCSNSASVSVGIIAAPVLNITPSNPTICSGSSTLLTASGGSNYTWSPSTGLSGTTGNAIVATPSATTTYTVTSQNSSGCASTGTVQVVISTATIGVAASSSNICSGSVATLTASGGSNYTWTPVIGLYTDAAATIAYTGTAIGVVYAKPASTTTYSVQGTTAGGCQGVAFSTITVSTAPVNAATSTGSSYTFCSTGTSTFPLAVNVTSAVNSMTWSYSTVQAGPYTSFTGVASPAGATFTPSSTASTNATLTVSGYSNGGYSGPRYLRLVITGATCSYNYNIQLYDTKGSGASLPVPVANKANICSGDNSTLSIGGLNTALTVQWQSGTSGGVYSNITGATSTTYTTPALTTTAYYKAVIGGQGSCGYTTGVDTITVAAPLSANTVSTSTACSNGSSPITVSGSSITGAVYQWQSSTTSAVAGFADVTGASAQNYVLSNILVRQITWYRRIASAGNCASNASPAVALYPPITNNQVTNNPTAFCGTAAATTINATAPAGADGNYLYQWQSSADGVTFNNIIGATSATYTTISQLQTYYYKRVVSSTASGCTSTSDNFVISVNALPTISITAATTSLCSGNSTTLTANGGVSYTWSPNTALSSTTGIVVTVSPAATQVYTVTGTGSNGCTNTASSSITVTTSPAAPTVSATSQTICNNGGVFNLNSLITSGAGTYEWFTVPAANSTYLVSNPASASQASTYFVFSKSGSCYSNTGASVLLNVADVSEPVVSGTTLSVCAPATGNLTSLQPVAATGTTLEWHTGNTSGSAVVPNPAAVSTGVYYLFAKSSVVGCYGNPSAAVSVTVNALPITMVSAGPGSICAPATINLNNYNNTGNNTYSYQWYTVASNPTPDNLVNIPSAISQSGNYYLYATSTANCKGSASPALGVTINAQPTAGITSPATACGGTPLSFVTSTNASTPSYVWELSSNAGTSYSVVNNDVIYSGATLPTLNVSNNTVADGYQFRYTVTDNSNCATTSQNAIITVEVPGTIASNPVDTTVTVNTNATFRIATSGSPTLNYQWKASSDGGISFNIISDGVLYYGTNSPELIVISPVSGLNNYRYKCEISNACTSTIASEAATLFINACPVPTVSGNVSGSATACNGANSGTLTLSGHVGSVIKWQSSVNGGNSWMDIVNTATTQGYANLTTTTLYRAVVQSGSCTVVNSDTATITVMTGQWIGGSSGNWNEAANWCGGIPTSTSVISIPAGATVNLLSSPGVVNTLTIAPGASLVMLGNATLTISVGGTFVNNGTFNGQASTGKVSFLGNGTISGTTTFQNIETYGALDFGTASTIAGEFTLQPGGSVTGHSPTYVCPSSSLIYNVNNLFSRGLEWPAVNSGPGYPSNVYVRNNTTINFPVAGVGYICNDLGIESGSALHQTYSGTSAALIVGRDVTISGVLTLGKNSGDDITLGGNWTRTTGGIFNNNSQSVTFNSAYSSTITAPASATRDAYGAFGGETFYNLLVDKAAETADVTLGGNITVINELRLSKGIFDLATGDVTLVSNDSVTAHVATIPTTSGTISGVEIRYGGINGTGTGKFIPQRYLPIGSGYASRRWRLLSIPLQVTGAPTINEAWQEGVSNSDRNAPLDPWPGFGTTITKSTVYNSADGYDQGSTNNPSMFYYSGSGTSGWSALPSTKAPITDYQAYMLFARGNRSIAVSTQYINASSTILEPKGRINTGDVQKTLATGYQAIGNPYASAISMNNVLFSNYTSGGLTYNTTPAAAAGIGLTYYVWDPKTSGSSGVGKFIACSSNGDGTYAVTANSSDLPTNGIIQSGAAFLLAAQNTGGTIVFHENDKVSSSSNTGVSSRTTGSGPSTVLVTNLYAGNTANLKMADGVISMYNEVYSDKINAEDAIKLSSFNTNEVLSITREDKALAVERRNRIQNQDTIYLKMANMNKASYGFKIFSSNADLLLMAFLEDAYTGITKPINLSDTAYIPFDITDDGASGAADRFRIVFKLAATLAITMNTVKAYEQNDRIAVEWSVENQANIKEYVVEKSVDGAAFNKVNTTAARADASSLKYQWLDENPFTGMNYYRVKSINTNGVIYSKVVNVYYGKTNQGITVSPNPATQGYIHVQLKNAVAGTYRTSIINTAGQVVTTKMTIYAGGDGSVDIPCYMLQSGTYQLQFSGPGKQVQIVNLLIINK